MNNIDNIFILIIFVFSKGIVLMNMVKLLIITEILLIIGGNFCIYSNPKVLSIMEKMDKIEKFNSDITVKLILTETRVNQGVMEHEGIFYRRDSDDAYLIIMTSPESEKGNGYLRVKNSMWMYRQNTRTFQLMARGQSIEGSDADVAELESRKYVDLYEPELDKAGNEMIFEETLGKAKIPVYRFKVKAKIKDIDYRLKEYWVRKDNFLKLKEQAFSRSGTLVETCYYLKYTQINGKYICIKQLFIDEFEKGNKTLLDLSGISLHSIDKGIFTKAYLENLSK